MTNECTFFLPHLPLLIDLSKTEVNKSPPAQKCQKYQFACKNGQECIAIYNICDGIKVTYWIHSIGL